MKPLPYILTAIALTTRLLALDASELAAVTGKFANSTPDEQYRARIELNRLIDTATQSGKDDRAAVTHIVVAALMAETTPVEAKKYLLRALARVGTPDAVEAATKLFGGPDAMLKEEARQVLESIPSPAATAALAQALAAADDPRDQLGLINSLGVAKTTAAVPALAALILNSDPAIARAAVAAIARIGDATAIAALKQALANPKLSAAAKPQVERALLVIAKDDLEMVRQIHLGSASAEVRLAAFLVLTKSAPPAEAAAAIEAALKKDQGELSQAALHRGLELNLPGLQSGLAGKMAGFSKGGRLVILAHIELVQPPSEAGKIALACAKSEDPDERIAALNALGKLATQPAFDELLQAIGAREPAINRAAGNALAQLAYPAADAALLALIKGAPGPDKLLALKAAAYRFLPGINPLLVACLLGSDQEASKEAMKTLYFTATIDDLRRLAAAAKSATDPKVAADVTALCSKIASRLDSPEAKQAIEGLK